jgi:hypothetical protein
MKNAISVKKATLVIATVRNTSLTGRTFMNASQFGIKSESYCPASSCPLYPPSRRRQRAGPEEQGQDSRLRA